MPVLGAVVVVVAAPDDGALEAVVVPAELEAGAAEEVAGAAVGEVCGPGTAVLLAVVGGGPEEGGAPGPGGGGPPGVGAGGSCLLPWTALKIC